MYWWWRPLRTFAIKEDTMKKLFAATLAIMTICSQALADTATDTIVADAVAACAKIDTLESGDIRSMIDAARVLNKSGSASNAPYNVDVKYTMSDGITSLPVSRSLRLSMYMPNNRQFSIDCSSGYHSRH
jgi:hypothetical protein